MQDTAKLFLNGQSQAVRLPKRFRFENVSEVFVKKIGNSLILTPKKKDVWGDFFDNLQNFEGKIKRDQPNLQERDYFA
ncbi:MAG: AbrB/MazE/SpoVT family DNA-binding domain-containing protein [Proteobacteria bacterium]|nr:MAG: AbrB/MazE/SpoVT family DNA-binding domain-containing protein [Pseudomonadota bacterium]